MDSQSQLSRRERQIMDIVYAHGEASGWDILKELPDPCARGALRVMLRILENKGHLTHYKKGREFIYKPTVSKKRAGPSALRRVVDTFFSGSLRQAVAAHLAQRDTAISDDELKRLAELIRQARGKGR
jgi:BlaI family transcriptional regulator, penicillinase repressor